MTITNEKFANAIALKEQNVPPIWFMRQAGRYHSHYQGLRKKHSFMELCKQPELAAETALGPVQDFDFDVSILFSDLLFPLQALGMGLEYTDKGPQLGFNLDESSISKLFPWQDAVQGVEFQGDAVKATREVLPKDKSLIGFVGSPWTLFVYAVEGTHKGFLEKTKSSIPLFQKFCESMVPLLKANIKIQLDAGAELVMLFDTAAGALAPTMYKAFVAPVIAELVKEFPGKMAYYVKESTGGHLMALDEVGATENIAGLGYDHRWSLPKVLKSERRTTFAQGNFDQSMLLTDTDSFKKAFSLYVEDLKKLTPAERKGWVSGLGHGVLPKTPEGHVKYFVDQLREEFA